MITYHVSIETNNSASRAIQAEEVSSAGNNITPTTRVAKGVAQACSPTPTKSIMKANAMTPSSDEPRFSKHQLMKLEPKQSPYTKYPVDCRVYYDFNPQTTSQHNNSQCKPKLRGSFCIGRVKAVYLDPVTKAFVYEVEPFPNTGGSGGNCSQFLTEPKLAYASGTPVDVQFSKNEAIQEGEIMGYCKLDCEHESLNEVKHYTVKIFAYKNIAQMYEDVHEDMLTYRQKGRNEKGVQMNSTIAKAKPIAKASLPQKLSAVKKAKVIKRKEGVKVKPTAKQSTSGKRAAKRKRPRERAEQAKKTTDTDTSSGDEYVW